MYRDLKEIIRDEVLAHLPANPLCDARWFAKEWKYLISSPFFVHTHSNLSRSAAGLFFQKPHSPPAFLSIDPAAVGLPHPQLSFLPEPVDIKDSSNGLLCCQARSKNKNYYICNPATMQYRKLPKHKGNHGEDPCLVLIYEPTLLDFVPNYKIVCAFPSADFEGAHEFEMYSSESGTWKLCKEICFGRRALQPKSGVDVNGVVYWQAGPGTLFAFDYIKDRSQIIPDYRFDQFGVLGAINGKLCLTSVNGNTIAVRLFESAFSSSMPMDSGARTWGDLHQFPINDSTDPAFTHEMKKLLKRVLLVAGDVIFLLVGRTIVGYNVKTKRTSVLHGKAESDIRSLYVPYVNSLVCL